MRDLKELASNKVESKLFALSFERGRLHRELSSGISAGVTIKEGYAVLDKISDDLEVYEYILTKINK